MYKKFRKCKKIPDSFWRSFFILSVGNSSGYLRSTFVTWFKSIGYLQLKQGTYLIRLNYLIGQVLLEVVISSMDIHDASIHIVVRENTVRHIRHILDLSESVEGDLAVDAFVAFRCAVLVPRGLDKSRSYGIDCNAFWLKFLYQRFGKEVDGSLGHAVYQRG